jgi:L-lactate dehydrogenase complex protein LldG
MEGIAMTSREQFLGGVREAVTKGARVGQISQIPARGSAGYQGAGPDPVSRFCDELRTVGGEVHCLRSHDQAIQTIHDLLTGLGAKKALLAKDPIISALGLEEFLRLKNMEVRAAGDRIDKDDFFAAEVGITGVMALIAETGSIVLSSSPEEPRSASLLPPVHIAVAERSQIVPDLFDLFGALAPAALPSCLSLVTGPSKTGDIELRLVTGVHGPGKLDVVLVV